MDRWHNSGGRPSSAAGTPNNGVQRMSLRATADAESFGGRAKLWL
jgi:hypothetical protein